MTWVLAYLAVPVVVVGFAVALDRWDSSKDGEPGSFAAFDRQKWVLLVVSMLLWPIAAVAIFRGWLSDRRNRRIRRSDR